MRRSAPRGLRAGSVGGGRTPVGGDRRPVGGDRRPVGGDRRPVGGDRRPVEPGRVGDPPLPASFGLALDADVRRPRPSVLVGGSPIRVFRLSEAGTALVERWVAGAPVGGGAGAGKLARRLLDAGMAHPRPQPVGVGATLRPGGRESGPVGGPESGPGEPGSGPADGPGEPGSGPGEPDWVRLGGYKPPKRTQYKASVVIPVRDRAGGLEITLRALGIAGAGAPAAGAPPIVVVDDGSTDPEAVPRAAAAARGATAGVGAGAGAGAGGGADAGAGAGTGTLTITVVRRDNAGGPAAARNTGWRSVAPSSEVVVFLDADCVPEPGWLETLLPHFVDPAVGAVAPRIVPASSQGGTAVLNTYERYRSPLDLGPRESPVRPGSRVPYVPTACLAVRRAALEMCGGFDEDLRFGEDVDLVWRLDRAGWRVRYEPSAAVAHPARSSAAQWLRQRFDYGRSSAALAERHGNAAAPLAVSPWSASAWGLVACGEPVAGALLMGVTAAALARRAGGDRPLGWTLAALAVKGNLQAGSSIAAALRRAWLAPAAAVVVLAWTVASSGSGAAPPRRALRALTTSLAVSLLAPAAEWLQERPAMSLWSWAALRLADDLAYQAGVWRGVVEHRSAGAIAPRF